MAAPHNRTKTGYKKTTTNKGCKKTTDGSQCRNSVKRAPRGKRLCDQECEQPDFALAPCTDAPPPQQRKRPKRVKVGVVSDLHLEFSDITVNCEDIHVLVLAGDTHSDLDKLREWVDAVLERYPRLHVVMVPGNHEFYDKTVQETMDGMAALRRERCHVLLNDSVVVRGVRFVGGTLWARMPKECRPKVRWCVGDFKRVRDLDFGVMKAQFYKCVGSILETCYAAEEPVVVVTHFGPCMRTAPKYGEPTRPVNRYFCNELETDIVRAASPHVWIHGHTHAFMYYVVGDTRVVCNPRGYSRVAQGHDENPEFQNPLEIEILCD